MARATKDAATRAREALDVAERRVKKLTEAYGKAKAEVERLDQERDQAVQRRDYLAQNPDLPDQEPEAAPRKSDDPVPEF